MKLNKMRNIRIEIDGIKFQSIKEGKRYSDLKMLVRAGLITGLEVQPKPYIVMDKKFNVSKNRHITYRLDFKYYDLKLKKFIHEDVKGRKAGTQYRLFLLKKCLMKQIYNIDVIEM